ncbi:MAG: hypothetical protein QXL68_00750 [Desulfurococcaceae archaeon]
MNTTVYCFVNEEGFISCSNSSIRKESERVYDVNVENDRELYVFETPLNTRVICSSSFYQTHIWGVKRYELWVLNKGLNKCFVSTNTRLINIREGVYIITKKNDIEEIDWRIIKILDYIRILNTRGDCVYLIDKDIGIEIFFENIVSAGDVEKILKHLYNLLCIKYSDEQLVNKYFELFLKQLNNI